EAVPLRVLRNERGRDQFRHVVTRLRAKVILLGERKERLVAGLPLQLIGVARQPTGDSTGAAIVGRCREIQGTELIVEPAEELDRRVGRTNRVASFVQPPVYAKPCAARRAR